MMMLKCSINKRIIGGASYPIALGVGGVGRNIYQHTIAEGQRLVLQIRKLVKHLARVQRVKLLKQKPISGSSVN